jgi:DNA processing protein
MTDLEAILILNAIPGLGPSRIMKLLQVFSSPLKILSTSPSDLVHQERIPLAVIDHIKAFPVSDFLRQENVLMKKHQVKGVSFFDDEYPVALKEIADPPPVLYVKGSLAAEDRLSVAIVGSRRATLYGISIAEKFSMDLCDVGFTIVSGLARGIDTAAHRGALRAKGRTLAVLGSGLASIYPKENERLANSIAQQGAVISEFPMTAQPLGCHFPRRNRIVSGLSLGVIVVEAAQKSGALITADFALEHGRDVFAVPGKIDSLVSEGVNNLIKQGARLVSNAQDIIEGLGLEIKRAVPRSSPDEVKDIPGFSDEEKIIFRFLAKGPSHMDQISDQTCLSPAKISCALLSLVLKKRIHELPGKIFAQTEK